MNRNCLKQPANQHLQYRKGTMIPFIAAAILVVGCCAALVLDRLYIDAARTELRNAAEASALASARTLVDDELLKKNPDLKTLVDHARIKGVNIAAENLVAGEPLVLDDSPQGDIRFGQLVFNKELDSTLFAETATNPHAVVVQATRNSSRNNPLALFFRELTGQHAANVLETAEALIDNRIVELRPIDDIAIPALPIGILENDRIPGQTRSWNTNIELATGQDNYGYDQSSDKVINKSDRIPEIVVRTQPSHEDEPQYNGYLISIGTNFKEPEIKRQFHSGINANDLKRFSSSLVFDGSVQVEGNVYQSEDMAKNYESLEGQAKIVFLVQELSAAGKNGYLKLKMMKPVVVRILVVRILKDQQLEIVMQPATLTTRTAITPDEPVWTDAGKNFANKYIYNLKLSN